MFIWLIKDGYVYNLFKQSKHKLNVNMCNGHVLIKKIKVRITTMTE